MFEPDRRVQLCNPLDEPGQSDLLLYPDMLLESRHGCGDDPEAHQVLDQAAPGRRLVQMEQSGQLLSLLQGALFSFDEAAEFRMDRW